jgi:hypothetical protein
MLQFLHYSFYLHLPYTTRYSRPLMSYDMSAEFAVARGCGVVDVNEFMNGNQTASTLLALVK